MRSSAWIWLFSSTAPPQRCTYRRLRFFAKKTRTFNSFQRTFNTLQHFNVGQKPEQQKGGPSHTSKASRDNISALLPLCHFPTLWEMLGPIVSTSGLPICAALEQDVRAAAGSGCEVVTVRIACCLRLGDGRSQAFGRCSAASLARHGFFVTAERKRYHLKAKKIVFPCDSSS